MKRWLVGVALCCLGWWWSTTIRATEAGLTLSALVPNPVGTDTNVEWVEVLNTGTATVSASGYWLRDGAGTPKTIELTGEWAAGETRSVLGLSLNNDTDWVELWRGDTLLEVSAPYQQASEGARWFKDADGEWSWWGHASPTPQATARVYPTPVTLVSAEEPAEQDSGAGASSEPTVSASSPKPTLGSPVHAAWAWPRLQAASGSVSAPVSMVATATPRPTPDFTAMETAYMTWKRQAWMAVVYLLWGGGVCLVMVLPWWWRWYLRVRVWW